MISDDGDGRRRKQWSEEDAHPEWHGVLPVRFREEVQWKIGRSDDAEDTMQRDEEPAPWRLQAESQLVALGRS